MQRLAGKAGIQGQISPHSLRHTFATIALDSEPRCMHCRTAWVTLIPGPPEGTTEHGTTCSNPPATTSHGHWLRAGVLTPYIESKNTSGQVTI